LAYADYQSTFTVWDTVNNVYAMGVRRWKLPEVAYNIEQRYLDACITGGFAELRYVRADGSVVYFPRLGTDLVGANRIVATNLPEHTQAWTLSAALRALQSKAEWVTEDPRPAWKLQLVRDVEELVQRPYAGYIDSALAHRLERGFLST
jgi:hypothetical protein